MRRKSFDALVSAGGVLLAIVLVAAGALAGGLALLDVSLRVSHPPSRLEAVVFQVVGAYAVLFGTIKIVTDAYDPFDTFLGAFGIVAGTMVVRWVYGRRRIARPIPSEDG